MAATAEAKAPASFEIDVEDVTYLTHGDKPLLARLYKPKGQGPFPVMIDLHGGAWCNQDRTTDTVLSEAMARSGVLVVAIDFRMPPDAAYPASLADINYAVRWVRSNAARLKAKSGAIGYVGISSGGHQGMLAAMRPSDPRYGAVATTEVPKGDARVQCVVLCWPVIDPLGRYRYGKEAIASGKLADYPQQLPNVLPSHDKFWGSEAAMDEGSPPAILERGEAVEMPPVLYVQGDADRMHPRPHLDRFVDLYRGQGGALDLALYPGEVEGFVTRQAKSEANKAAATARIIDFVHRTLG
ncbi:MAG: alpha/beta hydrolase [Hyphomicrobiaceae bacterium]|nr:alpha/beta hydrolase [Hyphomicrobiaceae bacterium]